MATKYLDDNGLLYFWQKIKSVFVADITYSSSTRKIQKTKNGSASDVVTLASVATSGDYADLTNTPTIPSGVERTTTTPKMDGTAAIGSETKFAAGDHVHPTDTSRQADLGLTSADVTKWNDAITLTKNNVEYSISGSEIVTDPTLGVQLLELKNSGGVRLLTGVGLVTVNDIVAQTYVPKTTTINGNALSGNITLDADDVSAVPASAKGAANGVAPLDANSKIDSQYLPSYVDDVIEAYPVSGATALSAGWLSATSGGSALTPEAGKIYVLTADSGDYSANSQFRWGGTAYVKLNDGGVSSITNAEIDTIVAS